MANLIVSLVIFLIVALALAKVIREKRKGATCVGCPEGKSPDHSCGCH